MNPTARFHRPHNPPRLNKMTPNESRDIARIEPAIFRLSGFFPYPPWIDPPTDLFTYPSLSSDIFHATRFIVALAHRLSLEYQENVSNLNSFSRRI